MLIFQRTVVLLGCIGSCKDDAPHPSGGFSLQRAAALSVSSATQEGARGARRPVRPEDSRRDASKGPGNRQPQASSPLEGVLNGLPTLALYD